MQMGKKSWHVSKWLNIKEPEDIYYNEKTLKTVTLFYLILKVQLRHLVMSNSLPPPWTAARPSSLSITNSQSLLKLMSFKSVMPSNHLILWNPLLLLPSIFPSIRVFSNESVLHISSQSIGASASHSLVLMNIQDWFPLWWTSWISLQSKGLSKSLLQYHSSKASILQCCTFFIVHHSHS